MLIAVQQFSTRSISDYYFNSLIIIGILIISLSLSWLFSKNNLRFFSIASIGIFLTYNFWTLFKTTPLESYNEKKQVVQFIKKDSSAKSLPCVSINLVADFTKNVGFRYLYWYFDLNVVRPSEEVPVYNVAFPKTLFDKSELIIGNYAIITPVDNNYTEDACSDPKNQLPELIGFT